jgi:hypothetical protein
MGRGNELTDHRRFTLATKIDVYFCDPQCPSSNALLWRGLPIGRQEKSRSSCSYQSVVVGLAAYGLMLTAWHNPTVTADIARWASQSARCGVMTTLK